MTKFAGKFCAALFVVCLSNTWLCAAQPSNLWQSDVDAAWKQAKESGRPLVMFITTDGCFFCDKMQKETFKDAVVAKELENGFVPVAVHARKNLALVQRMGIGAFPTTVIISKDAKIIAAMPGFVSGVQMRESLRVARVETTPRR